jgi:hypothetical protein
MKRRMIEECKRKRCDVGGKGETRNGGDGGTNGMG